MEAHSVDSWGRSHFDAAQALISQLAEELAFVEPGTDNGVLALNGLVMDLEDLDLEKAPPGLEQGIAVLRGWMEAILDGPVTFDDASIQSINEWHTWVSDFMLALEQAQDLPPMPEHWSSGAAAPEPAAAKPVIPLEAAPAPVAPQPQAAAPVAPAPKPAVPASKPAPAPAKASAPAAADDHHAIPTSFVLDLARDEDMLREFVNESVELLQDLEQGALTLESNPQDKSTIDSIFRAFHTFKGGAGLVHLPVLVSLAHELETLLDAVRAGKIEINQEIIDCVLIGSDALKVFCAEITNQLAGKDAGSPIASPIQDIVDRARAALHGKPAPAASGDAAGGAAVPALRAAAAPAGKAAGSAAASSSSFVKLDTEKLDNLVNLVGELVIAQSMVVQNPDVQSLNSLQLLRCLRQLSRVTSELQRNAMSLRMVPIRSIFQKMSRLVRDVSGTLGKQIQLELHGEDTELDRNIVEKVGDPLIHMIRNAVDHGIEMPEDRVAKGKPAMGTIKLSAYHQGGGIVISIQDDGKGLDGERILAKAIERGLVRPDAVLSKEEIYALIFLPGFSTAEKVTDLSGRGVGMDVVRGNIDSLRGRVDVQSTLGKGSTFTITLPLTLAIIDGLMVGVGDERYIIPTLSVRESFKPQFGSVSTVYEREEMINVRGRQTPLLRLGDYLGTGAKAKDVEDGIVVVVESGGVSRGILVDHLIGKQEVVIKSLGPTFEDQNLVSGGAVLGDGWVGLILDVDTLVKLPANNRKSSSSMSTGANP
jgi:two-component system chemotaxis sensor kinase CheA